MVKRQEVSWMRNRGPNSGYDLKRLLLEEWREFITSVCDFTCFTYGMKKSQQSEKYLESATRILGLVARRKFARDNRARLVRL